MLKHRYLLFALLLLLSFPVLNPLHAQKQGNIWYFGNNAGMDFNSGPPVALTNGALTTSEGCASICDANGGLLFYTDGINVYNRNHIQMPNGNLLNGNGSSTQSGVIVPFVGNPNRYYIFTCDDIAGPNGIQYSVVDMTSQAGMGDVVTKNTPLYTPSCEKITAVQHANGTDWWVITHEANNANFRAYQVTGTGINTTAVTTTIGSVVPSNTATIGQLKVSSNGRKIGQVYWSGSVAEIFDFNPATGVISNAVTLTAQGNEYGCEFSPDNTKFYVAGWNLSGNPVYQYDLTATNINASRVMVYSGGTRAHGSMQLAPDGKIYVARIGADSLDVINNPNGLGTACNYAGQSFYLAGQTSWGGLPTIIQSFFKPAGFTYTGLCAGDTTFFEPSDTTALDTIWWDFGDPGSGALNTSMDRFPHHIYSTPGSYTVTVIAKFNGQPRDTTSQVIVIGQAPSVDLGADTTLCPGNVLILDAGNPGATYLWDDNSTAQTRSVSSAGTYSVTVSNSCGDDSSSINVFYRDPLLLDLGPDTSICQGGSVVLDATNPNATYVWGPNGETTPTITVTTSGTYSVTVTNVCRSINSSINVTVTDIPVVNLGNDTVLCIGESLVLDAGNPGNSYLWSPNGETSSTITVTTSGTYSVEVSNWCGLDQGTVNVDFVDTPMFDLGPDQRFCDGTEVVLDATSPQGVYTWSHGPTSATVSITESGTYSVTATNGCGTHSDTISLEKIFPPTVDLGPDRDLCWGDRIELDAANPYAYAYLWNDGRDKPSRLIRDVPGTYSVTLTGWCGTASDEVEVRYHGKPWLELGDDRTICQDEVVTLDAGAGHAYYYWSDGNEDQIREIRESGFYHVEIANEYGCINKDWINITVEYCPRDIYVPNAFTPNGDGLNDEFFITQNGATVMEYKIFDRWGKLIFVGRSAEDRWNGTFDGADCPEGVYVVTIQSQGAFGKVESTSSTISLYR